MSCEPSSEKIRPVAQAASTTLFRTTHPPLSGPVCTPRALSLRHPCYIHIVQRLSGRPARDHLHPNTQQESPHVRLTFSDLNRKRLPSMCFLASRQLFSFSKDSSHAHACMSHIEPASPPAPPSSSAVAGAPLVASRLPLPPPPALDLGDKGLGAITGRMSATGRWESALMWRRLSSSGSAAAARCSSGADDLISPFVSLCLFACKRKDRASRP